MNWEWISSLVLYLFGILIIAITFKQNIKFTKYPKNNTWKTTLEKEHASQFVRNKVLPDHFFIKVNFKDFPNVLDDDCQKIYLLLLRSSKLPMLNLKTTSNLELKTIYGPQIIALISNYERNYFEFMDILFKYSNILYEKEYIEEARITLEQCILYHCDLSKCYLLLIKIYKAQHNHTALNQLKITVKHKMQDSPFLDKVLNAF